jgi:hypothetical protein
LDHFEVKGAFVYRLLIESPSRRMLVTKNRPVHIDHVELEYIPMGTSATRIDNVKVDAVLGPGDIHPIDFPEVARQATVRVYAKADPKAGYGNIDLTLIKAKVVDNADSPYADAVASFRAILRAVDNADVPSIRSMTARISARLGPGTVVNQPVPAATTVEVRPPTVPAPAATQPAPNAEIFHELQAVEDLLTGSESEKREGLEKLHQIVRRLRPR